MAPPPKEGETREDNRIRWEAEKEILWMMQGAYRVESDWVLAMAAEWWKLHHKPRPGTTKSGLGC